MVDNRIDNYDDNDLTLKEIFLLIIRYIKHVLSNWMIIVAIGLIFAALLSFKAKLTSETFHEKLTFMMDESKSGKQSIPGLEMLGSLFGNDKSGSSMGKILELFESKKIIHNTLFDSIEINGKKDFLANHYLDLYSLPRLAKDYRYLGRFGYKQSWIKAVLKNEDFRFTSGNVDDFTPNENLYLRMLYERIAGNVDVGLSPQLTSNLDEKTGIMTLRMKSHYEGLTLGILNNIYDQLSGFFIDKSVEKQKKTYNIMKFKRDSVLTALKSAEYRLADFKDSNRKLVTVKGYLDQLKLEREATVLNIMYGEVVKQLELTDFTLRNMTPVVQVIDLPRKPIYPVRPSMRSNFLKGLLGGMFLTTIVLIFRLLYSDIMNS